MAEWSDTTKHPASSFNAGNQYTKNDQMSLEALNNNIENALYAARVAENAQSATNNAVSYNAQTPLVTEQKQAQKNLGIDQTISFAETERQKSKNLFNENKYLSSYCTYASNKWTTNSTRIGYNQSILTNEAGNTASRNTSKLPLLKKGTYILTMFNVVNNTNDTSINIALYNQDGTINGTPITATIIINTTITFTLASDLYLDIRVTGNTGTISFDHIQVEQGTKSTDYQPYYGAIVHQGDITPTVLYDKDSTDANINWGYSSGISTSTGLTLEDKDFNGYSRLRCYFSTEGSHDGIYNGVFIVDVDLTKQVNVAGDNNYYCGIASTITPYALTAANFFEMAICRVGVDSTKSKITFGEYGWNKTAVVGRGTPCYKIEGIK